MKWATLLLILSAAPPLHAQTDAASYLKTHYLTPEQYVISKFRTNDIVILGEPHWVKHDPVLVQTLIPLLHKNGVHNLAIEFARAVDQPLIDSLLALPAYDEVLARRIFFLESVHWAFQEYIDILKAAWRVNHERAAGDAPFRVLGVNIAPNWSLIKTPADRTDSIRRLVLHGQTERDYADVVIKNVLRQNQKALIYCGTHHAFTHYGQPVVQNNKLLRIDMSRMGNYLWLAIADRIFMIALYAPWPGAKSYDDTRVAPAGGAIDRIVAQLGPRYKRIGFDLRGTPVGLLRDSTSVYQHGYEPFTLEKFADGMIYHGPISEYEPVTVIPDFVNESNLEYARANSSSPEFRNASLRDFYEANLQDIATIKGWAQQFSRTKQ